MKRRFPVLVIAALLLSFVTWAAVPSVAWADDDVEQENSAVVLDQPEGGNAVVSDTGQVGQVGGSIVQNGDDVTGGGDGQLQIDSQLQESDDSSVILQEEGQDDVLTLNASPSDETLDVVVAAEPDDALAEQQAALDAYAVEHANDIAEGSYAIGTKLGSSLVMDVKNGSSNEGAEIILWTEKTSGTVDNQRWNVEQLGGGYYAISSAMSGLYLDINSATLQGSPVVQWNERSDASTQRWIIAKQSDGSFKLVSGQLTLDGLRLVADVMGGSAKNGASVILWTEKDGVAANQSWVFFVPADVLDALAAEHAGDVADGTYIVSSELGSSLALDVKGCSKSAGATVIVWPEKPATNEGWTIKHNAAGYVTITNCLSGKVLDVNGASAKTGASVIQWTDKADGSRNQQWILVADGGTYKIVSALAGNLYLVLDVKGGSTSSGAATILWSEKAGTNANQRWSLKAAPEQYAHAHDIADGTYIVRSSLQSTEVLDVSGGSTSSGAKVLLWQAKGSKNNDNQRWKVTHDDQGYVFLTNVKSGYQLAVVDGITVQKDGTNYWVVELTSEGSYRLRYASESSWEGMLLGVASGEANDGAEVSCYVADGSENQEWMFTIAASVIIALDPGHGGNDSGATHNGYKECDMTWAITQACAAQLRAYGYEVYITVTQSEFKNTGKSAISLAERVNRAYKKGCIAIFSMHINAGGGKGAVVLVPNNSSYNHDCYTKGQTFAKTLLPKINAIGISTWGDGAWERNYSTADGASENRYYKVNGKNAGYQDYYGIVRLARQKGMLGVIIEHGFIDSSDLKLLMQDTVLKKLGIADAQAIAALYS